LTRLLAILTTLALVLAACGSTPGTGTTTGGASSAPSAAAKPTYGGTLTFGLENDVSNLDPMLSGLFVDRNIHYAMYDSLVRVDPTGKIIPWLAASWKYSDDAKSITFTLRTDVKYHDGSVFDAESVKWNIDRYITTKGSSRTADLGSVESVTVVDASNVRFNLKAAFSPLL
jgi:peptide/nickel transport system substrate-binding protein